MTTLALLSLALGFQLPPLMADGGASPAPSASSAAVVSAPSASPSSALAAHVLNRLGFGPRPGDIERLRRIGVPAWIDQQLHPERIDDRTLDSRLSAFETLALDAGTLFRDYHQPAQLERRQRLREGTAAPSQPAPPGASTNGATPARSRPGVMSEAQQRDRLIVTELEEAKILRAVYGERQLQEVLVDFWFNHFNVFAGKGPTRAYVTAFERDAIRPHVLGRFRDMLEAVAKSPAMLFYLDNWQNTAPDAEVSRTRTAQRGRGGRAPDRLTGRPVNAAEPRMSRGLNENYARELLELHTLGVEGGYTQEDVVNVARAFTGWTMRPMQGPAFVFAPALHARGAKIVLGHRITAGGVDDGRQVLDLLADHPSTARFIATKLAQKFVSDAPPPALVERAARRFLETHGDLREVTRTIVTSEAFLSPEAFNAKVKTPFEFVASALRATGADVRTALPVARALRNLGMPLYFCQPPTGYDDTAEPWVSSGALVARMNFAVELGGNQLRGVRLPLGRGGDVDALRQRVLADVLPAGVSDVTRETVLRATTAGQIVALAVGSPDFQRQ